MNSPGTPTDTMALATASDLPSADVGPEALSSAELRARIRAGEFDGNTSGLASGFVQCNLVILPERWGSDFLRFCQANPKPCPLLACSSASGDPGLAELGEQIDVRSDVPRYRVFRNGSCAEERNDVQDLWQDDFQAFALGCSFSFEEALIAAGLDVRNVSEGRNVPMYNTNIPCVSAGPFTGNMVVSMRPFRPVDAIRAIQICSRFPSVHGAPVHFGDPLSIGIEDI
ncbi:MAG: DUF1445 domain-containing protein, partial [Pseudomonadota bacterium]